ncbi:MAG: PEP-CTERM sorting domain-containing protein, partial [Planctomycetia bacterium]|nr:PEP-CTERM sorting domain-containing protein [Planctomycetia bacterium]
TYVGGNGFSFIDQQAPAAQSLDQLEWIAAHNIAHELMLAFGVGENYDKSGNFIDARNAQWSMMTSPTARFSDDAAQALNQALAGGPGGSTSQLAQVLGAQPVPEPGTLAVWALGALAVACRLRDRAARP